ncbi:helix-turn-helix domain-containing protein [Ammoniphilus sp. 3BR4]|uniref:helix-turn-helix domain-containing protein n=1 Tax=Ammoniphilus sp. 3BR4 TaxID=3158265 RepID=UPI003466A29E
MKKKIDIILHPIRMKVIQALGGGKKLSIQQIAALLPNIPQATLYRHVNKLIEHNILQVVQENQVRGTVERILAINEGEMNQHDLAHLSPEDHIELFTAFMTNLLGEFSQYAKHPQFDPLRDGVMYRQAMVHLSDEEWAEFIKSLSEVMQSALQKEPREDRKTRTISTIIIPQKKTN